MPNHQFKIQTDLDLGKFSGLDLVPTNELTFEQWLSDIRAYQWQFPEFVLLPAVRKSIQGRTKSVLRNLGPDYTIDQAIEVLTQEYEGVANSDVVFKEFYQLKQWRSTLKSSATSLTSLATHNFLHNNSVLFWYLLICWSATVPGRYLQGFLMVPVNVLPLLPDFLLSDLVGNFFCGAFSAIFCFRSESLALFSLLLPSSSDDGHFLAAFANCDIAAAKAENRFRLWIRIKFDLLCLHFFLPLSQLSVSHLNQIQHAINIKTCINYVKSWLLPYFCPHCQA